MLAYQVPKSHQQHFKYTNITISSSKPYERSAQMQ